MKKESDLYLPLKHFLESQHYEVKGEVQAYDVLAVRGNDTPVVVELKLSLNLDVLIQAVDRLSLTSKENARYLFGLTKIEVSFCNAHGRKI